MKKFIAIFTLIFAAVQISYAQDTLVRNNGMIVSGFIVETDSSTVTLSAPDTASREFQLFEIKNLLMIKHHDGRTEQFYSNDTLITMKGTFLQGKILEITSEYVSIFTYGTKVNDLMMITKDQVFMLRLHDGSSEVVDHDANKMSDADAFALGAKDAKKYFKTSNGAIAGSVSCGTATYMYGLGLLGEAFLAKDVPKNLHNAVNPNDQLLVTNPAYANGYTAFAIKKKKKDCWKAYACGVVLPVAALAVLVAAWS